MKIEKVIVIEATILTIYCTTYCNTECWRFSVIDAHYNAYDHHDNYYTAYAAERSGRRWIQAVLGR